MRTDGADLLEFLRRSRGWRVATDADLIMLCKLVGMQERAARDAMNELLDSRRARLDRKHRLALVPERPEAAATQESA